MCSSRSTRCLSTQAVKAAEAKLAELKVGLITAEAYQRGLDDELQEHDATTKALGRTRSNWQRNGFEQYHRRWPRPAPGGAPSRSRRNRTRRISTSQIARGRKRRESKIKQKIDARTAAGEIDEVAQAKAQIAKAEADLVAAKYDLDGTTHLAPANGRVANLALRPGVRATSSPTHAGHEFHRGG